MAKDQQKGGREASSEERRLWRFITRHDTPLHSDHEEPDGEAFDIDAYAGAQAKKVLPVAEMPLSPPVVAVPRLIRCGDYAGVDRRTANRFRKGQMDIEVIIDLHGHSQIDAFAGLQDCVQQSALRGKRMLLVITGKGRMGDGVLRRNLPLWLNAPSIQPFVLAFDAATRKDGGEGAFYVLLKRQKPHG